MQGPKVLLDINVTWKGDSEAFGGGTIEDMCYEGLRLRAGMLSELNLGRP
jgi:hypothetical protein